MSVQVSAPQPSSKSVGAAGVGVAMTLAIFVVVFVAFLVAPLLTLGLALVGYAALRARPQRGGVHRGDRRRRRSGRPRLRSGNTMTTPTTTLSRTAEPLGSGSLLDARLGQGVDAQLRRSVPEGICRTFRVLPYARVGDVVLVAAVDTDDAIGAQVIADRVGGPVQLVRHTVNEILTAIDETYPPVHADAETPQARRTRVQVAQMLTGSGLVDDEQLQRAMLEHSRTGDPLGDILVAHGAISEDVLVAVLSEVHQMQRVGLDELTPDPEVTRLLPEPLAQRLQAIPVAEADGTILLAVGRPLRREDAAAVETALGPGTPFRQLLANRTRARPAHPAGPQRPLRGAVDHRPDGVEPGGLGARRGHGSPEGRPRQRGHRAGHQRHHLADRLTHRRRRARSACSTWSSRSTASGSPCAPWGPTSRPT